MTRRQKKTLVRIIISAVLTVIGVLVPHSMIGIALLVCAYIVIGYDILIGAVHGIVNLQPFDESFLMAAATVGAAILGEFTECVAVMLLFQIGELFQNIAVDKSRRSIGELMDIRPDLATVENADGSLTELDPDEVEVGSITVIRPGERIPIDGTVTDGESELDTSSLTGESIPRPVAAGDEVQGGCINLSGLLKVKTAKPFGESTVSKILDLVENASSKKSRSEKFITRFARVYTPAVCISALVLAIAPPTVILAFGGGNTFGEWIYRALTFLVISCPCALVISVPLTFFASIGAASRRGILIKGSNYIETLAKTDTLAFDKTGTLTEGVFRVTSVHPTERRAEILELAAHAEAHSTHPIAVGIRSAYGNELDLSRISDVTELAGKGIVAKMDKREIAVGNARLMKEFTESDVTSEGTVYVAVDGALLGSITLSDTPKEGASEAIGELMAAGVKSTVMLTGDRYAEAERIASEMGITAFRAELLPQDKVQALEDIMNQGGKKTAFAGDGINDSPVISRADVGIAMGALGSDAAIEAADIVLMDDDIRKLPVAIRLAKKTVSIVNQNIYFAIGVKVLCLILGAVGLSNMWIAIFADVGVMVLAVLNALRSGR
jgi:Cd2+/Zn2+-exporting ATPase